MTDGDGSVEAGAAISKEDGQAALLASEIKTIPWKRPTLLSVGGLCRHQVVELSIVVVKSSRKKLNKKDTSSVFEIKGLTHLV